MMRTAHTTDQPDDEIVILQFDVDGAYLQADRLPGETWVLPPRQMYSKSMQSLQQPALPLHHPLYGEEDANAALRSTCTRRS